MSFRKRNVGLAGPSSNPLQRSLTPESSSNVTSNLAQLPGLRPSPVDGRPTTSTGTQTLDDLLAGHAGLALGNSLLIEENGATEFAGALLRYYAAEGVVQGHKIHVVGVGEQWGRELPGLVGLAALGKEDKVGVSVDKEKMKIAWRYERLGEFGVGTAGSRVPPTSNRNHNAAAQGPSETAIPTAFCHNFDLTKSLSIPSSAAINFVSILPTDENPFPSILQSLSQALATSPPQTVHRLIIPALLSPAVYPPTASIPSHVLGFLHSLRTLMRKYSTRLTVMVTLPLSLYPRSTGLVCWMEHLCDGVLELAPFPHSIDIEPPLTTSTGPSKAEEKPQGMVKVHKLPVLTEKGGGGGGGDDLAFSLSRKRFVIRPFSLPPVEGDQNAQRGEAEGGIVGKVDIEF